MFNNAYYEVIKPVFYYENIGYKPSNTWVGRSQALDSILVGQNAEPGDTFHVLVGGSFLVKNNDDPKQVSFWLPKHVFEKSYGPTNSAGDLFTTLEMRGVVRKMDKPEGNFVYLRSSDRQEFPKNHPAVSIKENSQNLQDLKQASNDLYGIALAWDLAPVYYEMGQERRVKMQIRVDEDKQSSSIIELSYLDNGSLFIDANRSLEIDGAKEFIQTISTLPQVKTTHIHERSLWANDISILSDDRFIEAANVLVENQPSIGQEQFAPKM